MAGRLGNEYRAPLMAAVAGSVHLSSFPNTFYIAFYTVAPSASGTGGAEVTGGAYARLAVPNDDTNWSGTAGSKSNVLQLIFPLATANWGSIVAVALMNTLTVGNTVVSGLLGTPFAITSGQRALFDPGTLIVTLT